MTRSAAIRQPIAAALLAICAATAGAGNLPLWELEGGTGRIILMGSVHFLRASDYPLPDAMESAYAAADTLVMEIDMDDIDPLTAQTVLLEMGSSRTGETLQDALGDDYKQASELADQLGIPLAMFDPFEPWFAALTISQLRMVQMGFDPAWGIEQRMTEKAARDGKRIAGLETLEDQLAFMDELDAESQKLFLLQSLEDAAEVETETKAIVKAWRSGDTATLEEVLLDGLQEAPKLYDALLRQRNRNWVPKVVELSRQPGTHLIVVGAMHLTGRDSLQSMLQKQGLTAKQLTDEAFAD